MGRNNRRTPQEMSVQMLDKELAELAEAKKGYANEVVKIKETIASVNARYEKIFAQYKKEAEAARLYIQTIREQVVEERRDLEKAKTDRAVVLADLEKSIANKQTECNSISLSFTAKEDQIKEERAFLALEKVDLSSQYAKLEVKQKELENLQESIDRQEKKFMSRMVELSDKESKVKSIYASLEQRKRDLTVQEQKIFSRRNEVQLLIGDNTHILKKIKEENKKFNDLEDREAKVSALHMVNMVEIARLKKLSADIDEKQTLVQLQEQGLIGRERNIKRAMKNIKEAQNG